MTVVETEVPNGDVSTGSWSPDTGTNLYSRIDESGSHDSDSSYIIFTRSSAGYGSSTFEVTISDPTTTNWRDSAMQVRDAESWKDILELQVRDGESWKDIKSIEVRNGEAWQRVVPEVVVRVWTRHSTIAGSTTFGGTVYLRTSTATIKSTALVVNSTSYVETVLRVNATDLCNIDPTDLQVRVLGWIDLDIADIQASIRITQVKVELEY